MQFINYLLTSIVAFIGIYVGVVLALIAPEELKDGRKYFVFLHSILDIAIILLALWLFFSMKRYYLMGILVLVVIYRYFVKIGDPYVVSYMIYGGVFYFYKDLKLFLVVTSLIFLHGLPTGTLLCGVKKKIKDKVKPFWVATLRYIWFLLFANGLYYLPWIIGNIFK